MNEQILDQELELLNGAESDAKVILEPWADEAVLKPQQTCRVRFSTQPEHRRIEIEYFQGGIVLYFPTGSVADFAR